MCEKVVIPDMIPGSSPFNSSCKPYLNLDSRFTARSAGRPGMTKCGFTLIELLVVVLIIGILASIALPKYKIAITKAKLMKMMPLMSAINQAEEMFYMSNGYYTYIKDVDVDIPQNYIDKTYERDFWYPDNTFLSQCMGECAGGRTITGGIHQGSLGSPVIAITFYGKHAETYPGRRTCRADHFPGPEICKSLGGVPIEGVRNTWLLP